MHQNPLAAVKASALRILAAREHSHTQLRRKLRAAGHAAEQVESALADLDRLGLLSDARFAELYVEQRSHKGYGPARIRAELLERGIDRGLIDSVFATCAVDWDLLLKELVTRRCGPLPAGDAKSLAACLRQMLARGFRADSIRRCLEGRDAG